MGFDLCNAKQATNSCAKVVMPGLGTGYICLPAEAIDSALHSAQQRSVEFRVRIQSSCSVCRM